jgi:hypothetical protein
MMNCLPVRVRTQTGGIAEFMLRNRSALSFILVKMIEYLTSIFIIPCSIFCGSKQVRKVEFFQKAKVLLIF